MKTDNPVEIPPSLYRTMAANLKMLENAILQDYSTELKMNYLIRIKNDLTTCAEAR